MLLLFPSLFFSFLKTDNILIIVRSFLLMYCCDLSFSGDRRLLGLVSWSQPFDTDRSTGVIIYCPNITMQKKIHKKRGLEQKVDSVSRVVKTLTC